MTMSTPVAAVPAGIAVYMAAVQFLFVTTWTVYVIYLPKLLVSAGLPASLTPVILIVDQLVFMVMDIYVGVAADRAQKTLGRVGPLVMGMTLVSCVAFLLLALGFQIHFSINSAGQYLKFTKAENLEWLMPVFWVGFGVAMMPGSALCKRFGNLPVMAMSALLGALGAYAAASAGSLDQLIAAHALAGGAWGSMLMCGFSAAMAAGRTGREGLSLGLLFAMLAAATLSRIAAVLSGAPKQPDYAGLFAWAPALCWLAGALLIGVLALRRRDSAVPA